MLILHPLATAKLHLSDSCVRRLVSVCVNNNEASLG